MAQRTKLRGNNFDFGRKIRCGERLEDQQRQIELSLQLSTEANGANDSRISATPEKRCDESSIGLQLPSSSRSRF